MLLLIVTCYSIGLHFIIFIVVLENEKKSVTVYNGFSPNFNSLKMKLLAFQNFLNSLEKSY